MQFNRDLGEFFDAAEMLPVASAHFAPDTRMAGAAGRKLLQNLVDDAARVRVPSWLDPCLVDFDRSEEFIACRGLSEEFVAADRGTMGLCRELGFLPTYSCINYQTVSPPRFGENLAWGDTGTVIAANSLFGARSNFEGGPSALASALLGCTPAYGLHLDRNRRANMQVEIQCDPREIADWGALAACSGEFAVGYETIPVFHGDYEPPDFDMLKQFGVALASYGGHAMFHLAGVTPEAPTLEAACGDMTVTERRVVTAADLESVYEKNSFSGNDVDLVVFAAPQLSMDEVAQVVHGLEDRPVHENTRLIMAVDPQVRAQADNAGLAGRALALGAEFTTGTCFYGEAPLMQAATGWNNLVTNSAKLVNTLASTGYNVALRRVRQCLQAAQTGRLP